jgi:hypothetical protein
VVHCRQQLQQEEEEEEEEEEVMVVVVAVGKPKRSTGKRNAHTSKDEILPFPARPSKKKT